MLVHIAPLGLEPHVPRMLRWDETITCVVPSSNETVEVVISTLRSCLVSMARWVDTSEGRVPVWVRTLGEVLYLQLHTTWHGGQA